MALVHAAGTLIEADIPATQAPPLATRPGPARPITLAHLRRILKGDGFSVVFQPIVDLRRGEVIGFEALSRFASEAAASPADWFADGRDHGLGVELEAMAVHMAIDEMRRHSAGRHRFVAVNVAAETLVRPAFPGAIPDDLEDVVLDVSEQGAIHAPGIARVTAEIRRRGGRIAVDDAAGANASLRQLLDVDCDQIKLDMDLLHRAVHETRARALARGLAAFAETAGLLMVAKGVETSAQRDLVLELGIPLAQGFLLGAPGPWPAA